MKVTAETITDEQIMVLLADAQQQEATCNAALWYGSRTADDARRKARARCAEIWNARHGVP